ncbi:MAG: SH3 domain-containing protein [Thermomicrobiales bacterium]|nr:SH3 domain-containing protein [Thermomicrobiales bacterium]
MGRALLAATLLASSLGVASGTRAAELDISVESVDGLSGLTAVVAHSDDGVNLRAEPGLGGDVLDTLPDGTVVELRVDETDTVVDDDARWWPVRHDGQDGWIAGFYLEATDASPTTEGETDGDAGESSGQSTSEFEQGDFVAVDTDDDTGLSMRAGPSTSDEILAGLGEGDVVQIMEGPVWDDNGDGWYLVTDGDFSAYVFGAYLVTAGDLDVDAPSVERGDALFAPGDFVTAAPGTDGVNVRSRASVNSRRLGAVDEGASVEVVDGPEWDKQGDVWYLVQFGGETGYMFGSLLVAGSSDTVFAASGPTGSFIYPIEGYVFTQAYGCSNLALEPWNGNLGCPFHNGIDLAAPAYTPVLAADGGTVVAAGWCDCGLGFYVEIDHGNGFATVYGHMAEQPYVAAGQTVNQGDVIGPVGSTGISTGPHVHFMLKVDGSTVDPLGYL